MFKFFSKKGKKKLNIISIQWQSRFRYVASRFLQENIRESIGAYYKKNLPRGTKAGHRILADEKVQRARALACIKQ